MYEHKDEDLPPMDIVVPKPDAQVVKIHTDGVKVVTQEEIDGVDLSKPLPFLYQESDIIAKNPNRAKALVQSLSDPTQIQKMNITEIRMAIDELIANDKMLRGTVSSETLDIMLRFDKALTNLHKNMYGTKNLNVNAEMKLSHAQVSSMMRKMAKEKGG